MTRDADAGELGYHKHLESITQSDVDYVRRKDTQYRASWKRRGGVGAFFTIVRPWDRLVAMLDPAAAPGDQREAPVAGRLNKPVPAFDILAGVEAEGLEGPDGSLIACIRDLRRYLLLLEAECWERSIRAVVERGMAAGTSTGVMVAGNPQGLPPSKLHQVLGDPRVGVSGGPTIKDKIKADGTPGCSLGMPAAQAEPDENVHSSLVPWAVSMRWRMRQFMGPGQPREALFFALYRKVAPGVWVLEPHVPMSPVTDAAWPAEVLNLYSCTPDQCTVRIELCPSDARDWFPQLALEQNAKEHSELRGWQQQLYAWDEADNKFKLGANAAWAVGRTA